MPSDILALGSQRTYHTSAEGGSEGACWATG